MHLRSGRLLCGLVHPVQLLQTDVQGVFNVLHQLLNLEEGVVGVAKPSVMLTFRANIYQHH